MQKNTKFINYAIVALIFLGLGFILSPGVVVRTLKDKLKYTKHTANTLYAKWDKDSISIPNGKTFEEFEKDNEDFVIYFWATWCPHCVAIYDEMNEFAKKYPVVGIPFERQEQDYEKYKSEKQLSWSDMFPVGEEVFVPRKEEFNIPLIPSIWVIKNGQIKKIAVGEIPIKDLIKEIAE